MKTTGSFFFNQTMARYEGTQTPRIPGWMSFTFSGASGLTAHHALSDLVNLLGRAFALWGSTGASSAAEGFRVQIDGDDPSDVVLGGNASQQVQWYQSPELGNGEHKVNVTDLLDGQALDFVVITPDDTTPLDGRTLVVDDAHPSIAYFGQGWRQVLDSDDPDAKAGVSSFRNGTYQTETAGDGFEFSFIGAPCSGCSHGGSHSAQERLVLSTG